MKTIFLFLLIPYSLLASSQEEQKVVPSTLPETTLETPYNVLLMTYDILESQIQNIETDKKNPAVHQQLQQKLLQILHLNKTTLKIVQAENAQLSAALLEHLNASPAASSSLTTPKKKKRHRKK